MDRNVALDKLGGIVGEDLRKLADHYHVTVFVNGNKNKGWAGQVIERHLGLQINSAQSPNFGSWELKLVSLKHLSSRVLTVKETMQITMIDPTHVMNTAFRDSHLLSKLRKQVICARIWESQAETRSVLYSVHEFDIDQYYDRIKQDYELVQRTIREQGFSALSGRMGECIQPRTKGPGHGSVSRAFYARVPFLKEMLNLV